MTRIFFGALGALGALALLVGATGARTARQVESQVQIESLDGTWKSQAFEGFSLVALGASAARVRFEASGHSHDLGDFALELLNGDPVYGDLASGSEESLGLRVVGGALVNFPIESFRSLRAADMLAETRLVAPEAGDRLWRRVGSEFDRIDGLLLGFTDAGLTFEGQLGEKAYSWAEVAALWVEPLGPAPKFEGSQSVSVELLDGSRLRGQFRGLGQGQMRLEVRSDVVIDLPLMSLLEINLDDARLRFVSELPFETLAGNGLFGDGFGLQLEARRDRSVLGGALVTKGVRYGRGIGVHAPSRLGLDWSAGGVLRGTLGIDDSVHKTAAKGSVIFRVFVDGDLIFESAEQTSTKAPLELPAIDLNGKSRIEFEVDAASDSVMGDRANWLDLRITKVS